MAGLGEAAPTGGFEKAAMVGACFCHSPNRQQVKNI
jgi:hypothetical protein